MPTTNVIVLPTCSICRDNEDETLNFVVTKCGHLFHAECMKEWNRHERERSAASRCPYCNNRLASNYDYYQGVDSDTLVRVHQLIKHRVAIIEDGKPDILMQGQGPYRELVTQEMSRLAAHAA